MDYCNSLLIGISEQNLDRLQRIQNKDAHIVCNASRYIQLAQYYYKFSPDSDSEII